MYEAITGIILSGGKSARMGKNKSFLKINGRYVIDRLIDMMKPLFTEVIIVTNEPELYDYTGLPVYEDIFKGVGPIAGIHSGLANSTTERNFIISCDIPLMNAEMITGIIDYPSDKLISIPTADGFVQHLCGVYSKSLIPEIENIINSNSELEIRHKNQQKRKCKAKQLVDTVPATIIKDIRILKGYSKDIFLNMNNPEDYNRICSIITE